MLVKSIIIFGRPYIRRMASTALISLPVYAMVVIRGTCTMEIVDASCGLPVREMGQGTWHGREP